MRKVFTSNNAYNHQIASYYLLADVHWGYYIYALICSLYIVIFSYNITYCDSLNPGVMPPSPISPFKYR